MIYGCQLKKSVSGPRRARIVSENEDVHAAFAGKMHTEYKHKILTKYLPAWMQILASSNPTIAYVDCYAGPGVYPDGSEGSPLKALEIAKEKSKKYGCTIWCFFNDHDAETIKQLQKSLEGQSDYENVQVASSQADAKEFVDRLLSNPSFSHDGQLRVPMFFFIDPFGLNVPMTMLKRIMSQPKTEVLITFMTKHVVRWGRTPAYERTMRELFDHPAPLSLIEQTDGRDHECRAVNAFVTRLRECAHVKHVIKYRIWSADERRTLFYMVHGSNHFKGFRLMKSIMYNIGVPGTFAYLGPAQPDEYQTQLDTWDSDVRNLMNHLTRKYGGETSQYQWIIEETYAEVSYIEKHFREALKRLESQGRVKVSGLRGKRGGFKPGTVFEFIEGQ